MNKKAINITTGILLSLSAGAVFAHGESIRGDGSGGAINAIGAEILEKKVISFRTDGRRYETFTDQQMVDFKLIDQEDVHMHSEENAYFLSLGFPVSDDMDINIVAQYNNFMGFKDNGDAEATRCFEALTSHTDPTKCISTTESSPGIGDTLVTGRYRFYSSDKHQIASIFGIIIPTGTVTNVTDTGTNEIIGTHNQPGSGAVTFQGGLGYSGHMMNNKIGITADVIARAPTQGAKQFQAGRSIQADIAFSYTIGKFVPVIELNYINALNDIEVYVVKKNSGGSSLALSPGFSYGITDSIGVFGNYSFLKNNLRGISNNEKYRFSGGIAYAFD